MAEPDNDTERELEPAEPENITEITVYTFGHGDVMLDDADEHDDEPA